MRKRIPPENKFISNVRIVDIAEEGKGVAKQDDLVFFVEKGVPGDLVDIELLRKKKSFAEARVSNIIEASEHRAEPFCPHFGTCGGCKWQHMHYESQLFFKEKYVENVLARIGKVDTSSIEPILGSRKTTYYRNKLEFTFSNKKWLTSKDEAADEQNMDALGFHVPGRFDKILDIEHCYLQEDPSNAIRNAARQYALDNGISFYDLRAHKGALRNLIVRTSSIGEVMVIVVFAYPSGEEVSGMMAFLHQRFPNLASLLYIVNQKKNDTIFDQEVQVYAGKDHIYEEMEGLRFKIGPKSFYQTNSDQAYELYKITRDFAGLTGSELVFDLYTGAGTIANFVSRSARKVVGIEYVPSAVEDAKVNSAINGVNNTEFFAGDMKDVLNAEFVAQYGTPDVIITDPPRAGMHKDVIACMLAIEAPKIVYVSCNAATQARDIEMLSAKYDVARIKPVDMFPQTQHVENVVLLIRK